MFQITTIKDIKTNLGNWCKQLRKSEKLTQKQLANELALSPLTISKLENGENPTIETLLKVLQYFDKLRSLNEYVESQTERLNTNVNLY